MVLQLVCQIENPMESAVDGQEQGGICAEGACLARRPCVAASAEGAVRGETNGLAGQEEDAPSAAIGMFRREPVDDFQCRAWIEDAPLAVWVSFGVEGPLAGWLAGRLDQAAPAERAGGGAGAGIVLGLDEGIERPGGDCAEAAALQRPARRSCGLSGQEGRP